MTGTERLRPHVPSPMTYCTDMVDLSPIMWTSLAYNMLEVEEGYRRETIYSLSDPGGGSPSTWTRSARYWTGSGQA